MTHRRSFLASMAAGAWLPAAVSQARAEPSRSPARKIRVGALNVGEYTFWGIWADILASQGLFGGGLLNMEITHCWDVNPKLAREVRGQVRLRGGGPLRRDAGQGGRHRLRRALRGALGSTAWPGPTWRRGCPPI